MGLAEEEAEKKGLDLPVLQQVLKEYRELEKEGKGTWVPRRCIRITRENKPHKGSCTF